MRPASTEPTMAMQAINKKKAENFKIRSRIPLGVLVFFMGTFQRSALGNANC
jgi:hypothetical protein